MDQNKIDALGRHIAENAEGSAFKKAGTDRDELVKDLLDGKTDAASLNPMGITRRPLTIAEMRDRMAKAAARIQADAATIAGMQWQPIETAPVTPDNLTHTAAFLGWCPDPRAPNGGDVRVCWWEPHQHGRGKGAWFGDRDLIEAPTHWMPLPNPPALKGGDHG